MTTVKPAKKPSNGASGQGLDDDEMDMKPIGMPVRHNWKNDDDLDLIDLTEDDNEEMEDKEDSGEESDEEEDSDDKSERAQDSGDVSDDEHREDGEDRQRDQGVTGVVLGVHVPHKQCCLCDKKITNDCYHEIRSLRNADTVDVYLKGMGIKSDLKGMLQRHSHALRGRGMILRAFQGNGRGLFVCQAHKLPDSLGHLRGFAEASRRSDGIEIMEAVYQKQKDVPSDADRKLLSDKLSKKIGTVTAWFRRRKDDDDYKVLFGGSVVKTPTAAASTSGAAPASSSSLSSGATTDANAGSTSDVTQAAASSLTSDAAAAATPTSSRVPTTVSAPPSASDPDQRGSFTTTVVSKEVFEQTIVNKNKDEDRAGTSGKNASSRTLGTTAAASASSPGAAHAADSSLSAFVANPKASRTVSDPTQEHVGGSKKQGDEGTVQPDSAHYNNEEEVDMGMMDVVHNDNNNGSAHLHNGPWDTVTVVYKDTMENVISKTTSVTPNSPNRKRLLPGLSAVDERRPPPQPPIKDQVVKEEEERGFTRTRTVAQNTVAFGGLPSLGASAVLGPMPIVGTPNWVVQKRCGICREMSGNGGFITVVSRTEAQLLDKYFGSKICEKLECSPSVYCCAVHLNTMYEEMETEKQLKVRQRV